MPIEPGFYIIRRDIVGNDNVFATGVGIEIPILGLPPQNSSPSNQRVRTLLLFQCKIIAHCDWTTHPAKNHSGKYAGIVTAIRTPSSNPNSPPV